MENKSKVFYIGKMVAYLCPCGTAHANGENRLCTACEKDAAQPRVQPTVATEPLEDSPWQTGIRRGAVIPSNRNSG